MKKALGSLEYWQEIRKKGFRYCLKSETLRAFLIFLVCDVFECIYVKRCPGFFDAIFTVAMTLVFGILLPFIFWKIYERQCQKHIKERNKQTTSIK